MRFTKKEAYMVLEGKILAVLPVEDQDYELKSSWSYVDIIDDEEW